MKIKKLISPIKNIVLDKNKPISLIHFITNTCNARCPHCFIDFDNQEGQRQKMTLESIEKLTKSIGSELMNVNITGGEPFHSNEIEEICRLYINNTQISSLFFSTNGGPVKKIKNFIDFARQFQNITFIFSISIDHIEEKHSNYRKVAGLFDNAMESYRLLKNASPNIKAMITITVSEFNANDIDQIVDTLISKYDVEEITANIVREEGVYKLKSDKKIEILEGYKKLIKRVDTMNSVNARKNSNLQTKSYAKMMSYKDRVMHKNIAQTFLNPKFKLSCYAGGGLMGVIYPNGDVYPCEVLEEKMGNLYDYDMDIQKLWSNNAPLREWIITSKCNCTYECAWSYNIIADKKHLAGLVLANLKS